MLQLEALPLQAAYDAAVRYILGHTALGPDASKQLQHVTVLHQ